MVTDGSFATAAPGTCSRRNQSYRDRRGRAKVTHALFVFCFFTSGAASAAASPSSSTSFEKNTWDLERVAAARGAVVAFEGRLPPEDAQHLHRQRLELERSFETERAALRHALEVQLNSELARRLRDLVPAAVGSDRRLSSSDITSGDSAEAAISMSGEEAGSSQSLDLQQVFRRLQNEQKATACQTEEEKKAAEGGGLPLLVSLPIIFFLVMLSGLFSGLTLGLMGLDMVGLQVVSKGAIPSLAKAAEKIMPVREKGNQLLCTLLLGNVAVNSALAILTADIANGLMGFLVSTALIVIFGEILPQAACSRYALQVGAVTVPIVQALMLIFYILTKPMSIVLDWLLGQEVGTIHSRKELMEMLKMQISLGAVDEATGDMAKQVAEGALNFRDKQAGEVMTPWEDAYMLSIDTVLGYDKIREIFETGYSRVPVYGKDKHDYKGLLYTKDLMLADPEDEMKLGNFIQIFTRKVETFWRNTRLVDCLNTFKKGGTHMGLVRKTEFLDDKNPAFTILGVLTLEDVMEEILQEEIVDETDVYVDVDNRIKVFGREPKAFDLGVFNPVWRRKTDRLSKEEVCGIAALLAREVFCEDPHDISGLHLSDRALQWLISVGDIVGRTRSTHRTDVEEPEPQDWLYHNGRISSSCTLVLQGRIAVRVGREGFRSEAGAFSVLAKDALRPGDFAPDFGAFLGTLKVRYLVLTKARYQEAQALDRNPEALEHALAQLAEEAVGAVSRKEAREIRMQKFPVSSEPLSPSGFGSSLRGAGSEGVWNSEAQRISAPLVS